MTAEGVQLLDELDPNTTLLGEVNFFPLATDDTYTTLGNISLVVDDPSIGLLSNDSDPDGEAIELVDIYTTQSVEGDSISRRTGRLLIFRLPV